MRRNEGWKSGQEITVISRESGSGTRSSFLEMFDLWQETEGKRRVLMTQEAVIVNKSGSLLAAIADNPYAIGYGSTQDQLPGVRAVAVDRVEPTIENIRDGSYPYVRPFFMAVRKDDVKGIRFLKYALSEEGQERVTEAGYLAVTTNAALSSGTSVDFIPKNDRLVIAGSTTVMPLAGKLAEAYCDVELQESNSGSGMYLLQQGVADVALLSRELTEEEKEQVEWAAVAMDGMAILVHEQNPIKSLSREQVRGIFMGQERVWQEWE